MVLNDVCKRLHKLNEDHTIYAREPWTPDAEALVAAEPEDGGLPPAATQRGMVYFLEVFLALEFLEGWQATLPAPPSPIEICERLIAYAENDA